MTEVHIDHTNKIVDITCDGVSYRGNIEAMSGMVSFTHIFTDEVRKDIDATYQKMEPHHIFVELFENVDNVKVYNDYESVTITLSLDGLCDHMAFRP